MMQSSLCPDQQYLRCPHKGCYIATESTIHQNLFQNHVQNCFATIGTFTPHNVYVCELRHIVPEIDAVKHQICNELALSSISNKNGLINLFKDWSCFPYVRTNNSVNNLETNVFQGQSTYEQANKAATEYVERLTDTFKFYLNKQREEQIAACRISRPPIPPLKLYRLQNSPYLSTVKVIKLRNASGKQEKCKSSQGRNSNSHEYSEKAKVDKEKVLGAGKEFAHSVTGNERSQNTAMIQTSDLQSIQKDSDMSNSNEDPSKDLITPNYILPEINYSEDTEALFNCLIGNEQQILS